MRSNTINSNSCNQTPDDIPQPLLVDIVLPALQWHIHNHQPVALPLQSLAIYTSDLLAHFLCRTNEAFISAHRIEKLALWHHSHTTTTH